MTTVTKDERKRHYIGDVLKRFSQHRLAMVGVAVLTLLIVLILVLPLLMGLDPYKLNIRAGFGASPSRDFILGTDDVGRDVFARLVYGGRTSLYVGFLSALISLCIGAPLGLLAGYYQGKPGILIMRLSDIFMSVPSMVLVLVLVSVIGPSIESVTIVIGIMGWPAFARQLYGGVIKVRGMDYVLAARAIGEKNRSIMCRYILPNAIAPIIITFTFSIASSILQESGLSFLGLGVQPPQASWGNILNAAQSITVLTNKPWQWIPPGIALLVTVLCINFIGDGLRDALDPNWMKNPPGMTACL